MDSRRHALLIGCDHFEHQTLQRLIAPRQDIEALGKVLSDPQIGHFDVVTVVNPESREALREIESLFAQRSPLDFVLLYYSGHGIKDRHGRLFLATGDTSPDYLHSTALSARQISDIMADSLCRRQVLVLDCCYSGAFPQGGALKGDALIGIRECLYSRGRVILTSSNAVQFSLDGDTESLDTGHSVFTKTLIDGLSTGDADSNEDGQITVDELYTYLYEHMGQVLGVQTPQLWTFGLEGDVVIGYTSHAPISILLGQYTATMGKDGQVELPERFAGLYDGDLVLAPSSDMACVAVYPTEVWEEVREAISSLPASELPTGPLYRALFSYAAALKIDRDGRFAIPDYLRSHAKLEREIVFLGIDRFCEIWAADAWEKASAELSSTLATDDSIWAGLAV